jgi:flagellar biosynthesis chaperone FliJ
VERHPLLILQSIRQRAIEQARLALAACLKVEAEALGRIDLLEESVKRDRAAASCMGDGQEFLQVFANRLDAVQVQRRAARAALAAAQDRVSAARVVVATARTRAEAVEQLIAEQMTARRSAADRNAQHALDDISRAARMMRTRSSISEKTG